MTTPRPEGTAARQAHLLDAAIDVVGHSGLRGLTHRALDRAAGLPEGSCSVYYRTRQALLGALTDHVAARLMHDVQTLTDSLPADTDDPTCAIEGATDLLIGWARNPALLLTISELSLEAVRTPSLHASMRTWRRGLVGLVGGAVARVNRADSERRAQAVVAALEGVAIGSLAMPEAERDDYLSSTVGLIIEAMAELET